MILYTQCEKCVVEVEFVCSANAKKFPFFVSQFLNFSGKANLSLAIEILFVQELKQLSESKL